MGDPLVVIAILVNGEERRIEPGLTLARLLAAMELPAARLAVERNGVVIPRERYNLEPLEAGDRLEIVTLVGGG
jgi:thiamine biosynthesis protein ThiS